jgi:hypothetical protein
MDFWISTRFACLCWWLCVACSGQTFGALLKTPFAVSQSGKATTGNRESDVHWLTISSCLTCERQACQ